MKTMTKPTKIEMFSQILSHLTDADEIAFIQHEIDLTVKKNASRSNKPTKNQIANASFADEIYNAMEDGKQYRVKDIQALVPGLSEMKIQRVSSIVTRMRNESMVTREIIKGIAYFTRI